MMQLLDQALVFAQSQLGVHEQPKGSNRGPEVDAYLRAVGLNPLHGNYAWCAAFVFWCCKQAALKLNIPNRVIRTAGVMDHWNRAACKIRAAEVIAGSATLRPGLIFVMSFGHGTGHTGFVESYDPKSQIVTTVEGNTNDDGSREGYEVARRHRRVSEMLGFIDYPEAS